MLWFFLSMRVAKNMPEVLKILNYFLLNIREFPLIPSMNFLRFSKITT